MLTRLWLLFFSCASLTAGLDERLQEAVSYSEGGNNPVGYLTIGRDHPIDSSTYVYVKLAIDHFKKARVPFIILRLDTPGGEVFAATQIASLLQRTDREDHIPVIAYIDNWALSAGAMLAYACRFIATTRSSSMGAAEPVMAGEGGQMESAPEKINSALRAEFANLASYFGRSPQIAEAMVDKDQLLVWRDGQAVRLEREDAVQPADEVITRPGKLLTLNAEQLVAFGVSDFVVQKTPLEHPFLARIPAVTLLPYEDWKIHFFSFLSHPLVSSLLAMGLLLGLYMEFSHPGFGLPGILALTCLALILLSSFAVQAASWLEVILLAAGLLLLLVEFLLLPGFGWAGVLGILLTLAGLFALMLPGLGSVEFSWNLEALNIAALDLLRRAAWLSGTLLLSLIAMAVLARRYSLRPRLLRRIVLTEEQEGAGPVQEDLPAVGAAGEAFSTLRPAGKIMVAGTLYDALADGSFIEKGERITVVRIEGSKIVVRAPSS
jgi:membrane-bound ClpP family serine protease